MAENVVVKGGLTEQMVRAGEELTRVLDQRNWPVSASFWFYFPETSQWRLILASPRVSEAGPKKAYEDVLDAMNQIAPDAPKISLSDVAVTDTSSRLVELLSKVLGTGEGISGIRFAQNVINGQLIEDAYIYRLNLSAA